MTEAFEFNSDQRERIYDLFDDVWAENVDFDTAIKRIENVINDRPIDYVDEDGDEDDDVDD